MKRERDYFPHPSGLLRSPGYCSLLEVYRGYPLIARRIPEPHPAVVAEQGHRMPIDDIGCSQNTFNLGGSKIAPLQRMFFLKMIVRHRIDQQQCLLDCLAAHFVDDTETLVDRAAA